MAVKPRTNAVGCSALWHCTSCGGTMEGLFVSPPLAQRIAYAE